MIKLICNGLKFGTLFLFLPWQLVATTFAQPKAKKVASETVVSDNEPQIGNNKRVKFSPDASLSGGIFTITNLSTATRDCREWPTVISQLPMRQIRKIISFVKSWAFL
jgi:hypothetical protein